MVNQICSQCVQLSCHLMIGLNKTAGTVKHIRLAKPDAKPLIIRNSQFLLPGQN